MKSQRLLFTVVFIGMALILTSSFPRTDTHSSCTKSLHQEIMIPSATGIIELYGCCVPPDPTIGEKIYKEKCVVCHQLDGKGLPGAFPPLAGSDYLLADKVRAVAQVLNGSNMEITVNKIKYITPMPPQVNNKEDAIAVINYVLNNFGNKGGQVSLEDVRNVVINPRK